MCVHPGFILTALATLAKNFTIKENQITIDNHQGNGAYAVHQARVRLKGDPTTYRMIIAPADAPIFIGEGKVPTHQAFARPLGDA